MVAYGSRNTDPASLGERFETRRDIDAIAEDVISLGDYIAKIDADPKPDSPLGSQIRVAVDHPALYLAGTAHRIDHARKFHQ